MKKPLLVYLDPKIHNHLRLLAEQQSTSMGALIRRALLDYYEIRLADNSTTTKIARRMKKKTT